MSEVSSDVVSQQALNDILRASDEGDIRARLHNVLVSVTAREWHAETSVNGGRIDLICPELCVFIEVKRRGEVGPATMRGGETQEAQVTRYLESISGGSNVSYCPWHGLLTDGAMWWGWAWDRALAEARPLDSPWGTPSPDSFVNYREFLERVLRLEGKDIYAAPFPPDDLGATVLANFQEELIDCIPTIKNQAGYRTKFKIWEMILRGSGIVPVDESIAEQEFAAHSVLVTASRMLVATMSGQSPSDQDLISDALDGFQGWIAEASNGYDIAMRMLQRLRGYQWRGIQRDVLKQAYHALISKEQRKEFGEYYTPDDLAELVVGETLDNAWIDLAVQGQAGGVLDPSCGSGTFLLHSAKRILGRMRTEHRELLKEGAGIVARLVHGMDIHPVAVEMAKATLSTALPPTSGSAPELRIMLGDAMQPATMYSDGLWKDQGAYIKTPGGHAIHVPGEIATSRSRKEILNAAVASALNGDVNPPTAVTDTVGMKQARAFHKGMTDVVSHEGNHVWEWHIGNVINIGALHNAPVARIVGNPPWLVANETPDGARKKSIDELRAAYQIRPKRRSSAKGDLATVFTARIIDLYADREGAKYGWVLPGSAIYSQAWATWLKGNWRLPSGQGRVPARHYLGWILDDVRPAPFPHAPNGTSVVFGEVGSNAGPIQVQRWSGPLAAPEVRLVNLNEGGGGALSQTLPYGSVIQTATFTSRC